MLTETKRFRYASPLQPAPNHSYDSTVYTNSKCLYQSGLKGQLRM